MPDGLAALQRLGVQMDPLQTSRFRGIRFLGSGLTAEAEFPSGMGVGIRRTTLHRTMVEHAYDSGVVMLWGTRVTGILSDRVVLGKQQIRCRWIIGADGEKSGVRRWAGLDACQFDEKRFGYRRHYHLRPWTEYMELYWGDACQIYVTPVGPELVCVALISRDAHLRLDDALPQFPDLVQRLREASPATTEQGGVSASRKLKAVCRDPIALIGDASGSIDAITGEGLCLAFRQAIALADALEAGSLSGYQAEHRRIVRRPAMMADLMLMLGNRSGLQRRALAALALRPDLFGKLLATHVGTLPLAYCLATGFALACQMLIV
jgi:flavin-dependent dehydrogenase